MSTTKIRRPFADGEFDFDLTFPLAVEFERSLRKSLYATMRAFMAGEWRINDASEIIRLGLIGGGTDEYRAIELVDAYVKGRPLANAASLALEILEAAFLSAEDDPAKEEADRVFGGDE